MDERSFNLLKTLLRPVSQERIRQIVRTRVPEGSYEQLTLADAGLEDEVRAMLRKDPAD